MIKESTATDCPYPTLLYILHDLSIRFGQTLRLCLGFLSDQISPPHLQSNPFTHLSCRCLNSDDEFPEPADSAASLSRNSVSSKN